MRLGEILKKAGLITDEQIDLVCHVQATTGEPFGTLVNRVLEIPQDKIEKAWADHMVKLLYWVDIEAVGPVEPKLLEKFNAQRMRDLAALPIKVDQTQTLHIALSNEFYQNAMIYFWHKWVGRIHFYLADQDDILEHLRTCVPQTVGQTAKSPAVQHA